MRLIKKLLSFVSSNWNKSPKSVAAFTVTKGSGLHYFLTVQNSQLHLHSEVYRDGLPFKQSILLNDTLTIMELTEVLTGMGYTVEMEGEAVTLGIDQLASYTILESADNSILTPFTIEVFTSPTWQVLYPISRLLAEAEGDIEIALKQLMASSARGHWLDYWASFFGVRRLMGEDDNTLARRIFVSFMNLKANNIAIQELLRYALNSPVDVVDIAPSMFKVNVAAPYMNEGIKTAQIIDSVRAAGVAYVLHYMQQWEENMPSIIADHAGTDFHNMDDLTGETWTEFIEDVFGWDGEDYLLKDEAEGHVVYIEHDEAVPPLEEEQNKTVIYDTSEDYDMANTMANNDEASGDMNLPFLEGTFGWKTSEDGFTMGEDTLNSGILQPFYTLTDIPGGVGTMNYSDTAPTRSEVLDRNATYNGSEAFATPGEEPLGDSQVQHADLYDTTTALEELTSEQSSLWLEDYGTIQAVSSYDVVYALVEAVTGQTDTQTGTATFTGADSYKFRYESFAIGTGTLNDTPMCIAKNSEAGYMELRNSSNVIVQSTSW